MSDDSRIPTHPCDWCGDELPEPGMRQSGDLYWFCWQRGCWEAWSALSASFESNPRSGYLGAPRIRDRGVS